MFGADTPLVIDALQIAGLAIAAGAAGFWIIQRIWSRSDDVADRVEPLDLEQRVRVLERIATDQAQDLSDEIESLREDKTDQQLEKGMT